MRHRLGSEVGASLVEFALVLPILLTLIFGIIDYGRLTTTRITLHEAVQEGSLYALTHPDDASGIKTRIVESVDNPVIDPSLIIIDCPSGRIHISLSHPMGFITPFYDGTKTLTAEVTADILTPSASCIADP